jgi:ectoine hydroxylase-related dioxygenase (phytanoyl-CoA dioxygenase family)
VTRVLTEEQRQHYDRDGILFPIGMLRPEEARRFRAACDELELQLGGKPRTVEVRQMHLAFPWAYDLATHPQILDAVEDLLGPNLVVWATELFAKHPHDALVSIGWHRDRPYMGFDGGATTTAWVALGASTPANGCMRAVPGPGRHTEPRPQPGRRTLAPEDETAIVDVILREGEMSLHDADIMHGSGPNLSSEKRVGFAIRFVTPDARPRQGRPPVILARGRDDHPHFTIVEPPGERSAEQALAAMREAAAHHLEAVLDNIRRTDS